MKIFEVAAVAAWFVIAVQAATLKGQLTDESGAVIPGARVTVRCGSTERSTMSDASGTYSIDRLSTGECIVTAATRSLILTNPVSIQLTEGALTLDLRLEVRALREEVNIQSQSNTTLSVESSSNASGLVIEGSALDALSDDPNDLQTDLQALAGPSAGPSGGAIFIDGFSGGEIPPKESIREVRINQDPFSPEFDKLGYGRIEIFTKPGAAKLHGTADYNFAHEFWNSRNPYSPEKAPLLLDEFEGGGGGPLGKRATFTLDAQRNMVDNGSVVNAVTVDPATFLAVPYTEIHRTPQRFTRLSPRVDYQLDPNNVLTFRYSYTHGTIDGAGIGAFDLTSRGYLSRFTHQTVQATETSIHGALVNETRFQYYRSTLSQTAKSTGPSIVVLSSFNGGASPLGASSDSQNSYEFQNLTSAVHGSHMWRLGGRFRAQLDDSVSPGNFAGTFTFGSASLAGSTITSVERYRRTLLYLSQGYSASAIRALGGGATQFSVTAGVPEQRVHQMDTGIFFSDNWRLRPNLTLNYGLRYEAQSNISDWRDVAPRVSIAWAPGVHASKGRARTIIRGGAGLFYDRFPLSSTLAAARFDGVAQRQYIVTNPDFYPIVPSAQSLTAAIPSIQRNAADLRAPYILQSALTVERQLTSTTTFAATYTNSHGLHLLRSRNVNAPLPGVVSSEALYPLGTPGAVFLAESSGLYNQNQLISNVTTKFSQSLSLFGFYVFNRARADTDGVGTMPANPYRYDGEYGPAATDVHHRVTIGGSLNARWNIRLSPFVILQSGAPFNVTSGNDPFDTTVFNARPALATDRTRPGLVQTEYGLLDPNPTAAAPTLGRNYGRGPGQYTVNLRLAKTIGFGPEKESGSKSDAAPGGSNAQRQAMATTGAGIRNIIGTPSTPRRYNLVLSLSARNILNHNNPGPIIGNITSPLFGRSNQVAAGPNGEGFSENASNRRLELQIRFNF